MASRGPLVQLGDLFTNASCKPTMTALLQYNTHGLILLIGIVTVGAFIVEAVAVLCILSCAVRRLRVQGAGSSGLAWRLSGLCLCTRRKPSARELREREDEAQWEAYDQSPVQTASNGSKPAIEMVSWARSPPQPPEGSPTGPLEPFDPATSAFERPQSDYPRDSQRPWTSRLTSVLSFGRGRPAETRYDDDGPRTEYQPQTVYDDQRLEAPRSTWRGDGSPNRDFTTLRPSHSPSNGPLPRPRQTSSRRAPTEFESYRPRTATETYAPRSGDRPRETDYEPSRYRSRTDRPSTYRSRTAPSRIWAPRDESYRPQTELTDADPPRPPPRIRTTPSRSMSDVRTTYAPARGTSFASSLPRRFSSVFGRPSERSQR